MQVPKYSSQHGFKLDWEADFEIKSKIEGDEILILANKAGLFSLAKHLLLLATDEVPRGTHFHLNENNSLESGSVGLVFEKS